MKKNNKKEYGLKINKDNLLFFFVSSIFIISMELYYILRFGLEGVYIIFISAGVFVVSLFMIVGTEMYLLYTVLAQLYMSLIYVY